MARSQATSTPLSGMVLQDASDGESRDLGQLAGVNVLVLLRHRH